MLKEIREQEDSRYPANMTPKPINMDNQSKNMTHYDRKSTSYDKGWTYAMRQANVQLPDPAQEEPDPQQASGFNAAEMYNEGYYVAVVNTANEAKKWGRCFNCSEEGHQWQKCTKPLKESLRRAKEWIECKNQSLNRDGGAGAKGVWPPGRYGPGYYGQGQQLAGPQLTPSAFWNEDPRRRWLGRANVGLAILDGVKTTCLIDNGACVNLVTLEFVKARGLGVGSIQDLNNHNGCIPLSSLGGNVTEPLGYVVIQVQIPYIQTMTKIK